MILVKEAPLYNFFIKKDYLNGHCFVSLMLCIPVCNHDKTLYLGITLGYRMWQKKESKLKLAASMVRSCKGIEMMVNLINVAYSATKILLYEDERFSEYRDKSVQDFRFALSEGIRQQIFFATFVQNIENRIKSSSVINAVKQAIFKQEHYL